MTEHYIPYVMQTKQIETRLLSAVSGHCREIWSSLAPSEMEEENLDTVSGQGCAGTSELVSKEMMLTRMYLIWGSVLGSLGVAADDVLLAETSIGNLPPGLVHIPGMDPLVISKGMLQNSDSCWLGGAPQVPLPLSVSWWVTSVCSWPQSQNSRSSTMPPTRATWTQQPWRQKGYMYRRHLPA